MEHNRNNKLLMIIALVVGIVSLSVGFAAFSTTLNISSSASVSPNSDTFSVKFSTSKDKLLVNDILPSSISSGVAASNGIIDNSANPMITNLTANFTAPGQYVEYVFYARNEGEYTAYLNGINFVGNKSCIAGPTATDSLVQSACDDINIIVSIDGSSYYDTTTISGHSLDKSNGEVIKIRLEYASDGTFVDGEFSIIFPHVLLIYSTIDDSSYQPTVTKIESGDINTVGSIVSFGNEKFYVIGQENGNVKLLSMYNLLVGWEYGDGYLDNISGIQDERAKGYNYDIDADEVIDSVVGVVNFAEYYTDYSNSNVKYYVDNYAAYLSGLGVNVYNARLIRFDELVNLGCSEDDQHCSNAPRWVYSTSYWTMTLATDYTHSAVWAVTMDSNFYPGTYNAEECGVRPVIEVPISEF